MAPAITTVDQRLTKGRYSKSYAVAVEKIRNRVATKVADSIGAIIDAQIVSAKGGRLLKVTKETKDGTFDEWHEEAPSTNAAKMLLEFTIPKAVQEVKHTGAIGIVHLIKTLEGNDDSTYNQDDE